MATWAIGKTFLDTRARSLHYRFYRFNHLDLLVFLVDDLCQILGMFSLNSIGCVTKCGPAGILEEDNRDGCMALAVSQIFTQKDLK